MDVRVWWQHVCLHTHVDAEEAGALLVPLSAAQAVQHSTAVVGVKPEQVQQPPRLQVVCELDTVLHVQHHMVMCSTSQQCQISTNLHHLRLAEPKHAQPVPSIHSQAIVSAMHGPLSAGSRGNHT